MVEGGRFKVKGVDLRWREQLGLTDFLINLKFEYQIHRFTSTY